PGQLGEQTTVALAGRTGLDLVLGVEPPHRVDVVPSIAGALLSVHPSPDRRASMSLPILRRPGPLPARARTAFSAAATLAALRSRRSSRSGAAVAGAMPISTMALRTW